MSTGEKTVGQRIAALCEAIDKFWRDRDSLDHVSVSTLRSLAAELDMPMDNGDGTVTTFAPVTVPKEWLETGRKIVRVGSAKQGDVFYSPSSEGFIRAGVDHCMDEVRVILSDPPAPQFREGKYYRTRGGEVVGPIWLMLSCKHGRKWACAGWAGWFADGRVYSDGTECDGDLLPGEVTVWKPPVSLKAGEYVWTGHRLCRNGADVFWQPTIECIDGWVYPPKPGRYKVPGNGKIATWEGDA